VQATREALPGRLPNKPVAQATPAGLRDLTDECVAQFTAHRRRQGRKEFVKPHAVEPVLRYLRKLGAAPPSMAPSETPVDLFIREYADHLARERGLTAATIRGYGSFARRFITGQPRAHWLKWERIGKARPNTRAKKRSTP
jgi:hypothetical protein